MRQWVWERKVGIGMLRIDKRLSSQGEGGPAGVGVEVEQPGLEQQGTVRGDLDVLTLSSQCVSRWSQVACLFIDSIRVNKPHSSTLRITYYYQRNLWRIRVIFCCGIVFRSSYQRFAVACVVLLCMKCKQQKLKSEKDGKRIWPQKERKRIAHVLFPSVCYPFPILLWSFLGYQLKSSIKYTLYSCHLSL